MTPDTPCLEWTGSRHRQGYGIIRRHSPRQQVFLHRLVWEAANGPIPDGIDVLHSCDNPPCFRLDHLFLGTHADNMADMLQKGRVARGEANGRSRTNWDTVHLIRRLSAEGHSDRSIAQRVGMSKSNVNVIVSHRTWKEEPHAS